jgi:hypothetical protein
MTDQKRKIIESILYVIFCSACVVWFSYKMFCWPVERHITGIEMEQGEKTLELIWEIHNSHSIVREEYVGELELEHYVALKDFLKNDDYVLLKEDVLEAMSDNKITYEELYLIWERKKEIDDEITQISLNNVKKELLKDLT